MNRKQALLRINSLILKDEQMVRGYELAIFNCSDKVKVHTHKTIICRLRNSRLRKFKALKEISEMKEVEFSERFSNWVSVCNHYHFRPYKL